MSVEHLTIEFNVKLGVQNNKWRYLLWELFRNILTKTTWLIISADIIVKNAQTGCLMHNWIESPNETATQMDNNVQAGQNFDAGISKSW